MSADIFSLIDNCPTKKAFWQKYFLVYNQETQKIKKEGDLCLFISVIFAKKRLKRTIGKLALPLQENYQLLYFAKNAISLF